LSADPADVESFGARLAGGLGVRQSGRALKDFLTYLPSQVLPALAGLVALPILARRVTPSELGVLAIAQTLITLGWVVSTQWMTASVMRDLPASVGPAARSELGVFVSTLRAALAVSGALFLGYCSFVALLATFSGSVADTFWYVAAGTLGFSVHALATTLFAAQLRPFAFAVVEVTARAGGIALGIALVFAGRGIHGYLLATALALLVIGVLGTASAWPRTRAEGASETRRWLGFGLPVATSAIAVWLLVLVDRYLLAAIKGTASVGIYSVGNVVGDKMVALPTFAFFVAARPLLVRAFEHGGRAELERLMHEYTRVLILVGLPAVAVVTTTAKPLVMLVTGHAAYDAAATVAPIVAVGSFILALGLVGNVSLTMARRTMPFVYAALAGLAVNVAANLVLIPSFGVKGAAIATPIGNLVYLLTGQRAARHEATWRFPVRTFATALAAAALAIAAGFGARALVDGELGDAIVAGASTTVTYAAIVMLARRFERRP
jgi:O-antigen/teichoic acid export membrane protein